jgi:hypothetical protein
MSGKRVFLSGLLVALLGLAEVRGQDSAMGPAAQLPVPNFGGAVDGAPPPSQPGVPPGLSNWIAYCRGGGCCGPVGGDGHIDTEVYFRTGLAFTLNTGGLSSVLDTVGFSVGGGGRVLFFNAPEDAAWTVDLGINNIQQNVTPGSSRQFPVVLPIPNPNSGVNGQPSTLPGLRNVTISGLNRTYVNASIGREWYVWGNRNTCDSAMWRWGVDGGARYGTERVEFQEINHKLDVIGGLFLAVHSDLEIPCGGCIWQVGIRGEYSYTWSDVLQRQNDADIQDLNLLLTLGVRF